MVVWITGLSGSGKTTLSKTVYNKIKEDYKNTVFLDGDIIREALNGSFGYTLEERRIGARQIHGLCNMLDNEGLIVICATMSLFNDIQKLNRENFSKYIEIYLDVEFEELVKRDKKSLYSKALAGTEENVVGVNLEYEKPLNPELSLSNNQDKQKGLNINLILEYIYKEIK